MPRLFAVQLKDAPAERYEQWVNTPVYTRDYDDCVGWLGCELPEDGHSCEFAELAGDGAVTCVSSSKVNRLREENAKLQEYITAVANDVYGSHLFNCMGCRFFDGCYNDEPKEHDGRGCQWLLWARELGIEVE